MGLWDPEAWDGKIESLPEQVRAKLPQPAPQETPEQKAAREAAREREIGDVLNKRNVEAHIEQVRSRVPADKFDAAATSFRKAVLQGGVTLDQASSLFFPPTPPAKTDLQPPPKDPAGATASAGANATAGAGATAAATQGGEWTESKVREKQAELRKLTMSQQIAFRREPANADFLKAEIKLYKR